MLGRGALLGFLLTGAATLVGFARLDQVLTTRPASWSERRSCRGASSLRFALESRRWSETVEATSLSWTVMPGAFADRIVGD